VIKEIAFTAYPSKNVQATREWYEKTLGLRFSAPFSEDGVEKYNESNVGGAYFSLMTHEWMEAEPGSGNGVAFEVDNIEDTIGKLRGAGIEIADPYETPVCKVTTFKDPEGNKVTLHQITVPH
jgi:predicted enzyme related to lactoylglutathione lyase